MDPIDKEQLLRRPRLDRLTSKEASDYLRITDGCFDDLVKEGVFPPGDRVNQKNHTWRWEQVLAMDYLLGFLLSLRGKVKNEVKNVLPKTPKIEESSD